MHQAGANNGGEESLEGGRSHASVVPARISSKKVRGEKEWEKPEEEREKKTFRLTVPRCFLKSRVSAQFNTGIHTHPP